ncbi:MAG: MFS transporter [Bacteroidetes bacterium]|nr:MFS transporter [Bacteroidota bacterium]
MQTALPDASPYAALKVPEYRLFAAARFSITFALQMQAVIISLMVYALTHDPLSIGLVGLSEIIPAIAVGLYAGHIVDRKDRRTILIFTTLVYIFCTLGLLFIASDAGQIFTHKNVSFIYAISFLGGLARGFMGPSVFSLFAQILPKNLYTNGATWNSTAWQVAAVAGPATGGFIYGFANAQTALVFCGVLLLAAFYFITKIKKRKPLPPNKEESIYDSLTSGFRFIFNNKIILGALSLDLFAVLFGGAVAMLPFFAHDILHIGAAGLGILRASPAAGAVITALVMAHYPPTKNTGRKLLICVAGFGACIIVFGLSQNFFLSLFVLALSGGLDNVSVVIRGTILQNMTPDNMRGRVAAVNSMFIGSSNELGEFESGVTARWFGVAPSVIIGGCMTLIVVGFISLANPVLRKLDLRKR